MVTLYKLNKECYLLMDCLDATRMLLFVVRAGIPASDSHGLVDAEYDLSNAQLGRERKPKGREFLC